MEKDLIPFVLMLFVELFNISFGASFSLRFDIDWLFVVNQ